MGVERGCSEYLMIELRDFNLPDLLNVCYRLPASERELFAVFAGSAYSPDDDAVALFSQQGLHWIFVDGTEIGGTRPVAAGGLIRQRAGVYRSWFRASTDAWKAVGMTRAVREVIANALKSGLAHRIETVTLADRSQAREWYGRIGLQYESTLHGYGVGGEDAVMYVAVRKPESA